MHGIPMAFKRSHEFEAKKEGVCGGLEGEKGKGKYYSITISKINKAITMHTCKPFLLPMLLVQDGHQNFFSRVVAPRLWVVTLFSGFLMHPSFNSTQASVANSLSTSKTYFELGNGLFITKR